MLDQNMKRNKEKEMGKSGCRMDDEIGSSGMWMRNYFLEETYGADGKLC